MKRFVIIFLGLLFATTLKAQVGIRVGVNMANEINTLKGSAISDAFKNENLTAYKIGLAFQSNARKNGVGLESGIFYSQKGASFKGESTQIEAYKKTNNIEIPLNVRLRLGNKYIGGFGMAGIYGDYIVNGKLYYDSGNNEKTEELKYDNFEQRFDYGYAIGLGIDAFSKLQLGVTWSQGLQKKKIDEKMFDPNTKELINITKTNTPRVFSVHLTYVF